MNLFKIVWSYLKAKPLNTVIHVTLLSLGIGVINILIILNRQLEERITENTRGIDLVIGAKGSPLQLILCNIFHVDFPTGNINLREADRIAHSRHVKRAIPMALGDAYKTFRIIGTTRDYPELYRAKLASGEWWSEDLTVTIGSDVTGLKPGDIFTSAHGLTEGGHDHDAQHYVVTGVMQQTNSVLDNLILTNVRSIWLVHESHGDSIDSSEVVGPADPKALVPGVSAKDSLREITSMLVQYRTPLAAIQLPRAVNAQSSLQAASPAFETARLFSIMGVGMDIMLAFAYVLIAMAGLSIFIALFNSLRERRYDMAIMRSMGAGRTRLFMMIIAEGTTLTMLGSVIGIGIGHGVVWVLGELVVQTRKAGLQPGVFYAEEWILLGGSLLLGVCCSMLPAVQAYRTDISRTLAGSQG